MNFKRNALRTVVAAAGLSGAVAANHHDFDAAAVSDVGVPDPAGQAH